LRPRSRSLSPTSSGRWAVCPLTAASEPSFDYVYGAALATLELQMPRAPGEVKVRVYNP
jgi:hypothetical protein